MSKQPSTVVGDDENPVYEKHWHCRKSLSVDLPQHWEIVEDESHLLQIEFHSTNCPDANALIIATPFQLDIAYLEEVGELHKAMKGILEHAGGTEITTSNLFRYPALHANTADGCRSWTIAHEDLLIAIQVRYPDLLEHIYQPLFERILSSLRIHREREGARLRLQRQVSTRLLKDTPNDDVQFQNGAIVWKGLQIGLDNLESMISRNPTASESLIDEFVNSVLETRQHSNDLGQEAWEQVADSILPMVRPDSILRVFENAASTDANGPQGPPSSELRQLIFTKWLADLIVCYAVDTPRTLRMINQSDLNRWNKNVSELHQKAIDNLVRMDFPNMVALPNLQGEVALAMLGEGGISCKSSYALHPRLFAKTKGTFPQGMWVAIPSRDSIVIFSKKHNDKKLLLEMVAQDFRSTDHAISDRLFDVTPDGLVLN